MAAAGSFRKKLAKDLAGDAKKLVGILKTNGEWDPVAMPN